MNRVCLFAGYNRTQVDETVYLYLKELSNYADVYYLSDGVLDQFDKDKLDSICKGVYSEPHGMYDFGSYSLLAKKYVGWDNISQYDSMILANDSCICVNSFQPIFHEMEGTRKSDCWALLATDELNWQSQIPLDEYIKIPHKKVPLFCFGSYFMSFSRRVFLNAWFQEFINSVEKEKSRALVCEKYEIGLTRLLIDKGETPDSYIDTVLLNAAIYGYDAFHLVKSGFPLIKKKIFTENPLGLQNIESFRKSLNNRSVNYFVGNLSVKLKENNIISTKSKVLPPIVSKSVLEKKLLVRDVLPPILFDGLRWGIKKIKDLRYSKPKTIARDYAPSSLIKEICCEEKLVIFFNVSRDLIGGGMLSINRFAEQSILHNSSAKTVVSGIPIENNALDYSLFKASSPMIHFDSIVESDGAKEVQLNIPEVFLPSFIESVEANKKRIDWLLGIDRLHINILNQNIDLLPNVYWFNRLRKYTNLISMTVAHQAYLTPELSKKYDCPVSLLTPFLPKFHQVDFSSKKKTIAVSADVIDSSLGVTRDEVLLSLKKSLPDYEFVTIENMGLEDYKKLIANSLFSITFGEGYDGYFVEPYLSQSVAFAIYNEEFFTEEFKNIETVFPSWNVMLDELPEYIRELENNPNLYNSINKKVVDLIKIRTNDELSTVNLLDYMDNKYDFIPEETKYLSSFFKSK